MMESKSLLQDLVDSIKINEYEILDSWVKVQFNKIGLAIPTNPVCIMSLGKLIKHWGLRLEIHQSDSSLINTYKLYLKDKFIDSLTMNLSFSNKER